MHVHTAALARTLTRTGRGHQVSDRRLAITFLGIIAIIAVLLDGMLLLTGRRPPGGLLALAGVCAGALATLVTSVMIAPGEGPPRVTAVPPAP